MFFELAKQIACNLDPVSGSSSKGFLARVLLAIIDGMQIMKKKIAYRHFLVAHYDIIFLINKE